MPTDVKGWQCDDCKVVYAKKHTANQCEKDHKKGYVPRRISSSQDRCIGCGSSDCGGECEISDMDFNN